MKQCKRKPYHFGYITETSWTFMAGCSCGWKTIPYFIKVNATHLLNWHLDHVE